MGALAKALEKAEPVRRCAVGTLLRSLDDDDVTELLDALGRDISHIALAAAILAAYDCQVSDSVIGRHRRGVCACGPTR